ncbi:hypothetical protein FHW18_003511 [Pigmentiphaga litoralis]|uniref:Uncharacterized protein n=1 Tax=Pigmentiphaga litoralis TaxID=516702 RepID=A0A7Y9LPB1_9BURK|nr:hypothetical protein [Pigmentiphaga litoralis]NYE84240.1 hypothetical protein [Pigmentiphaga litoralis]
MNDNDRNVEKLFTKIIDNQAYDDRNPAQIQAERSADR